MSRFRIVENRPHLQLTNRQLNLLQMYRTPKRPSRLATVNERTAVRGRVNNFQNRVHRLATGLRAGGNSGGYLNKLNKRARRIQRNHRAANRNPWMARNGWRIHRRHDLYQNWLA